MDIANLGIEVENERISRGTTKVKLINLLGINASSYYRKIKDGSFTLEEVIVLFREFGWDLIVSTGNMSVMSAEEKALVNTPTLPNPDLITGKALDNGSPALKAMEMKLKNKNNG